MTRHINTEGLSLIKNYEGLRLWAYKPVPTEKWFTIGYGHTGKDVTPNMTITKQQAEDLLKKDLSRFEQGVESCVKVSITDNQFSALVSFAYNCGVDAFKNSTLLKKLNNKDYTSASNEFLKWNKANGKPLAGLTRRRNAERNLFLKHETHNNDYLPYEVKTNTDLNIRIAPSVTSSIIRTVPKDTVLKVWAVQTLGGKLWGKNGVQYFCLDYCTKV